MCLIRITCVLTAQPPGIRATLLELRTVMVQLEALMSGGEDVNVPPVEQPSVEVSDGCEVFLKKRT